MAPPLLRTLLVVLVACKEPGLLADTPIVGGSDEVRDVIRAELAAFDEATGFGRTRVSEIRVKDLQDRRSSYDRLTRRITVDEVSESGLVETLRHELCHALNATEELHKEHRELYGRVADGLFSSEFVRDDYTCATKECKSDETFAGYCQLGPWVSHALKDECSTDPKDGQLILNHLADAVWIGTDAPRPTHEGGEWSSIQLSELPSRPQVRSTAQSTVVQLSWFENGSPHFSLRDVHTGQWIVDPDLPTLEPPEGSPVGLPLELFHFEILGETDLVAGPSGWSEGPYRAAVQVGLFAQGAASRQVYSDGENWWLVGNGCLDEQIQPFIADGQLLTLRPQGIHLGWGPVTP
jgi:hypothetical protein